GSDPYVRYGSFFSRTERDVGEVLTLRYRSDSGGALSKLPYDFPSLAFPGDDSRSEDLAPSEGNMYLRWETPQSALTYGGVTPESRRSNTYASRTSPMTGL